jgi:hypothetical protein
MEAQVQPVDTCRVEIRQAANGSVQVSTRATDRATDGEAERAVRLAVKMFNDASDQLDI